MTHIDHYKAQWRMATTEAGLERRTLLTLGIPAPVVLIYQEASQRATGLDGSQKLRGSVTVQANWEPMNRMQAARLRAEIEAGQSAGWLYMTIDRGIGKSAGPDWVDIRGRPYTPEFAPMARSFGQAYEALSLQLGAVEIINAPSDFATVRIHSLDFSQSYNSGYITFL